MAEDNLIPSDRSPLPIQPKPIANKPSDLTTETTSAQANAAASSSESDRMTTQTISPERFSQLMKEVKDISEVRSDVVDSAIKDDILKPENLDYLADILAGTRSQA